MSKAPAMKNDTNATRARKPKAWEFSWDDWDAPNGAPRPAAPTAAKTAPVTGKKTEAPPAAVVLPFRAVPAAPATKAATPKTTAKAAEPVLAKPSASKPSASKPSASKPSAAKDSLLEIPKAKPTPIATPAPKAAAPSAEPAPAPQAPPRKKIKAWEFAWDNLPETPQPSAPQPSAQAAAPSPSAAPKAAVKAPATRVGDAPVEAIATPPVAAAPVAAPTAPKVRAGKKTAKPVAAKPVAAKPLPPTEAAPERISPAPVVAPVVAETTAPRADAAKPTPATTPTVDAGLSGGIAAVPPVADLAPSDARGAEQTAPIGATELSPATPAADRAAEPAADAPVDGEAMAVSAELPPETLPPVSLHPSLETVDFLGEFAPVPGQAPSEHGFDGDHHLDAVASELGQIATEPQQNAADAQDIDVTFGLDTPPGTDAAGPELSVPVTQTAAPALEPSAPTGSPAPDAAEPPAPVFRKPQRETVYVPGFGKNARPRAVEVVTNVRLTPKEERKPRERLTLNRNRADAPAAGSSSLFGTSIREAMARAGVSTFDEVHAVSGLSDAAPAGPSASAPAAPPVAVAATVLPGSSVAAPAASNAAPAVDTEELRRQYEGVRIVETAAHVADMLRDIKDPREAAAKPDLGQRIKDTLHAMKRAIADVELQLMGVRR